MIALQGQKIGLEAPARTINCLVVGLSALSRFALMDVVILVSYTYVKLRRDRNKYFGKYFSRTGQIKANTSQAIKGSEIDILLKSKACLVTLSNG